MGNDSGNVVCKENSYRCCVVQIPPVLSCAIVTKEYYTSNLCVPSFLFLSFLSFLLPLFTSVWPCRASGPCRAAGDLLHRIPDASLVGEPWLWGLPGRALREVRQGSHSPLSQTRASSPPQRAIATPTPSPYTAHKNLQWYNPFVPLLAVTPMHLGWTKWECGGYWGKDTERKFVGEGEEDGVWKLERVTVYPKLRHIERTTPMTANHSWYHFYEVTEMHHGKTGHKPEEACQENCVCFLSDNDKMDECSITVSL